MTKVNSSMPSCLANFTKVITFDSSLERVESSLSATSHRRSCGLYPVLIASNQTIPNTGAKELMASEKVHFFAQDAPKKVV